MNRIGEGDSAGGQPESGGFVFRLVTYNIHKCIGGADRRYHPERIVAVLEECRADIVFLQEVDEGVPRSRADRQVDLIGEALNFSFRAYCPTVRLRRGHYGNAVLSRFELEASEKIDLTMPLRKRRGALYVRVAPEASDGRLRLWLFNVHLGLIEPERRWQLRRLLKWTVKRAPQDAAIVVAGDFNDVWGRLDPMVMRPEGFRTVRPMATFPATRPVRALDRIFVRGPIEIVRCFRARMAVARQASDHLPLVSVLRVVWPPQDARHGGGRAPESSAGALAARAPKDHLGAPEPALAMPRLASAATVGAPAAGKATPVRG